MSELNQKRMSSKGGDDMSVKFYEDNHITIYHGDCRQMSELPDNSVQCIVTSPP